MSLERILARVHKAFQAAGCEYAVAGEAAAWLWGSGEEPEEVEVIARLAPGDVDDALAAARSQGFDVDPGLAALAAEGGEHLTFFPGDGVLVDVKPARGASDLAALRTRMVRRTDDTGVAVTAVEETIARVLEAGGPRALPLAAGLLHVHAKDLDSRFLGQRCEELGVTPALREAAEEAGALLASAS